MHGRGGRLTVFVLLLAALAGAAYAVWTADERQRRDTDHAREIADEAVRAALAIGDLRASQQASVAAGQTASFWFERTTSGLQAVHASLATLGARAVTADARQAAATAASIMKDFEGLDNRVREYLATNQPLAASDLIFADGLDMLRKASAEVETVRRSEEAAAAAGLAATRQSEALVATGALILTLVVAGLLLPARARGEGAAVPARPAPAVGTGPSQLDDTLGAALDARLSGTAPPSNRAIDLGATATLCTDLARMADPKDLTALLARAADLLDASGVVVWIADPVGAELLPTVAHGYPTQALGRLGSIKRDGDNAAAAAFRSGSLQVVTGGAGQRGAVIAPLLTMSGCVGVITVETRNAGERSEGVRAATSLIAAQLATLVSAAPATRSAVEPKAGTAGSARSS